MKKIALVIALMLFAAPALFAQRLNIDLPRDLADRAAESVDITLDGDLLKMAAKFMSNSDVEARDMIRSLQGIYVRSYEFDKEKEYDASIVGKLRAQLGPSWKRIVYAKSRDRENTEIYVDSRNDGKIGGLVILVAEPKELTIVNLVGTIDVDKLSSLEGQFGIPKMSGKGKHDDE